MLNEATRYITRKIKSIEYINTRYPQDYEAINAEYRRLRNGIKLFSASISSLESYEAGGSIMKNFSEAAEKITDTLKINMPKDGNNLYIQSAKVGEYLANTTHNSSIKNLGNSYALAYEEISKCKKKFNGDLKTIQGSLKVLKDTSKSIDSTRKRAEDLRYDLEEKIQHEGSKEDIDKLQAEFDSKSEEALRGMKSLMGDIGLAGILKKVAASHKEFFESSRKALENIK